MQPVFRHGARLVFASSRNTAQATLSSPIISSRFSAKLTPWTCTECRSRTKTQSVSRRWISMSARRLQAETPKDDKPTIAMPPPDTATASPETTESLPPVEGSLPSQTARQRGETSERMNKLMDSILARASIASQHINVYTGTDYSGIESLRKNIIEQEQKVKTCLVTLEAAKASQQDEIGKQSSSQKEIVSLLERKAGWSPTDLERYMALVRSEHLNEQATQAAKDKLVAAERELEDGRALLEKLERKQYHEEQVWSDTIRRNSTWVTFGLMGVNIVLLLANILIFEPYRRRKIVRDVKAALDEKTVVASGALEDVSAPVTVTPIEKVEEETTQPLDAVFAEQKEQEQVGDTPLATGEMLPEEVKDVTETMKAESEKTSPRLTGLDTYEIWAKEHYKEYRAKLQEFFSERVVSMKQVDVTTIALQGAAAGASVMALSFMVFGAIFRR